MNVPNHEIVLTTLVCCMTSVTGFCTILGVKTTNDRKFILQNRNPEHMFTALLLVGGSERFL